MENSKEFSSSEQIYLWKLIQAEFKPDMISTMLDYLQHSISIADQHESLSGLLCYLTTHSSHLQTEHVKLILQLPAKVFKVTVYIVLNRVKSEIVKDGIIEVLKRSQFHTQINLFKHLKYWVEQKGKLSELIKVKGIQEVLSMTLQAFSSDYFKEFNCLLETSHQLYTL